MGKSYVGQNEAADVLQFTHWFNYRWGRGITAYGLSKAHGCSRYTAGKILEQLWAEGLLDKDASLHRPGVNKKVYRTNAFGEKYYVLFGYNPPSERLPGIEARIQNHGSEAPF